MKFELTVESMEDAVLGRAALDGLLSAYAARGGLKGTTSVKVPDIEKLTSTVITELTAPATLTAPPIGTSVTAPAQETQEAAPEATTEAAATGDAQKEPKESAKTGGFSKEQIKQAAEKNTTLAALVQGRGRKSDAQRAEINRLTSEVLGIPIPAETPAEPIGAALKGATAQDLQAALKATTQVVHAEPGVEVRTAVQPPAASAPVAQQAPAAANPSPMDSSLAELLAARKAATAAPAPAAAQPAEQPAQTGTVMPPTPPFADDAQYQQGKKPLDQMNADELHQAIRDYSDQGAGLFWFREVVQRSKAGDQNKMSVEYMREVLANPQAYYPNAV